MVDIKRWHKLSKSSEKPSWFGRNDAIRQLINNNESVLDLGCGNRYLESILDRSNLYTGVDCTSENPSTIIINFNDFGVDWPKLEVHDVAVCSGVLEYLQEPGELLQYAAKYSKRMIVTYVCEEDRPKQPDSHHGWVNRYSKAEMLELVSSLSLKVINESKCSRYTILVLES